MIYIIYFKAMSIEIEYSAQHCNENVYFVPISTDFKLFLFITFFKYQILVQVFIHWVIFA